MLDAVACSPGLRQGPVVNMSMLYTNCCIKSWAGHISVCLVLEITMATEATSILRRLKNSCTDEASRWLELLNAHATVVRRSGPEVTLLSSYVIIQSSRSDGERHKAAAGPADIRPVPAAEDRRLYPDHLGARQLRGPQVINCTRQGTLTPTEDLRTVGSPFLKLRGPEEVEAAATPSRVGKIDAQWGV